MPTSPWTLTYPRGPLDEPLIDEKPPDPDYWTRQAKDCWKACLDFTTLLHTIENSRVHSNLVQTPTVAFSCFAVGIGSKYPTPIWKGIADQLSYLLPLLSAHGSRRRSLIS